MTKLYQAVDGKLFENKWNCIAYEEKLYGGTFELYNINFEKIDVRDARLNRLRGCYYCYIRTVEGGRMLNQLCKEVGYETTVYNGHDLGGYIYHKDYKNDSEIDNTWTWTAISRIEKDIKEIKDFMPDE
jgi:hypothetical protein